MLVVAIFILLAGGTYPRSCFADDGIHISIYNIWKNFALSCTSLAGSKFIVSFFHFTLELAKFSHVVQTLPNLSTAIFDALKTWEVIKAQSAELGKVIAPFATSTLVTIDKSFGVSCNFWQ
jgi:hypothetical protein